MNKMFSVTCLQIVFNKDNILLRCSAKWKIFMTESTSRQRKWLLPTFKIGLALVLCLFLDPPFFLLQLNVLISLHLHLHQVHDFRFSVSLSICIPLFFSFSWMISLVSLSHLFFHTHAQRTKYERAWKDHMRKKWSSINLVAPHPPSCTQIQWQWRKVKISFSSRSSRLRPFNTSTSRHTKNHLQSTNTLKLHKRCHIFIWSNTMSPCRSSLGKNRIPRVRS